MSKRDADAPPLSAAPSEKRARVDTDPAQWVLLVGSESEYTEPIIKFWDPARCLDPVKRSLISKELELDEADNAKLVCYFLTGKHSVDDDKNAYEADEWAIIQLDDTSLKDLGVFEFPMDHIKCVDLDNKDA